LDVHRDFCEVAIAEEGKVRSAGRIRTTVEELELFAQSLGSDDHVGLETTGNALTIARLLEPFVARVVVADTQNLRARRIELVKDLVAMANSGGGVLVIGVRNNATLSGVDLDPVLNLDLADIVDKVARYTGEQLAGFSISQRSLAGRRGQGTGRPRVPDRVAFNAIVFVLVTGIGWRFVPGELGCSCVAARRRLRDWRAAGLWERLHCAARASQHRWGRACDGDLGPFSSPSAPASKEVVKAPGTTSAWVPT